MTLDHFSGVHPRHSFLWFALYWVIYCNSESHHEAALEVWNFHSETNPLNHSPTNFMASGFIGEKTCSLTTVCTFYCIIYPVTLTLYRSSYSTLFNNILFFAFLIKSMVTRKISLFFRYYHFYSNRLLWNFYSSLIMWQI